MTDAALRIGLIGCGKQATKHISGLLAAGAIPVLADIDAELAQRLADEFKVEAVSHPDELFADASIAGIDICTPTPTHGPLIEKSIAAARPFFVEKPLAGSFADAQALHDLAVEHDVPGMVGYIYRFAPAFEKGHEFITSTDDAIGELTTAFFRIGGRGSHQPWKHLQATDGGAINEMMVHMIDLIVWFFGRVESVHVVRGEQLVAERQIGGESVACDTEDIVIAELVTEQGVRVLCQADMVSRSFLQFVDVQGTNGSFFGSISPQMTSFLHLDNQVGPWPAGRIDLAVEPVDLYIKQMAEFTQLCADPAHPIRNTLADSVHVLEVVEMVRAEMGSHD